MNFITLFWVHTKHNLSYANYRSTFRPFWSISVHFIYSVQFGLLHSIQVQFSLLQSNQDHSIYFAQFIPIQSMRCTSIHSVQLGPFGPFHPIPSIRSTLVHLVYFGLIWSIRSSLLYTVKFGPFGSLKPIRSNLFHAVHLGLFGQIWFMWSTSIYSVHLVYFRSLQSNSM